MINLKARRSVGTVLLLTLLSVAGCSDNSDSLSQPTATPTADSGFHASRDYRLIDLGYFSEVFGQAPSDETPQASKPGGLVCVLNLPGETATSGSFSTVAMTACTSGCEQPFASARARRIASGGAKPGASDREYRVPEFHEFALLGSSGKSVDVSIAFVPHNITPRLDLDVAAEHFARTARLEDE